MAVYIMSSVAKAGSKRSWVSVSLSVVLLGLLASGLLSFVLPYGPVISGVHTWFGLGFILLIGFHLSNNLRPLLSYMKARLGRTQIGLALTVSAVLLVGVTLALPPFSSLLELGYQLRNTRAVAQGSYQTIFTNVGKEGLPLQLELRAGQHYQSPPQPLFLGLSYRSTPQLVFWLEDEQGNYLQTLYVTKKISHSEFRLTDIRNTELQRRPEALPVWSHKRGVKEADGLVVPQRNNQDLDGVTAATPVGHYDVRTVASSLPRRFRVLMEINRSYDFNAFYTKDRYPDDPVYSGSGSSGQPSIVYAADVNLQSRKQTLLMSPVGHGHYSGANGELYADMEGIDTALELVERIVVTVGGEPGYGK